MNFYKVNVGTFYWVNLSFQIRDLQATSNGQNVILKFTAPGDQLDTGQGIINVIEINVNLILTLSCFYGSK